MSFPVKPGSSMGRNLLNLARRIKAKARYARYGRGYLAPLDSSIRVARAAKQIGLQGIARVAREGDRAAMIELKSRKGDFS